MIDDPKPDARLRDDIAEQVFTNIIGRAEGLSDEPPRNRQVLLGTAALIAYEAAEELVKARRLFRK